MAFPGRNYAPPGTYTETFTDNPLQGALDSLKIPVFIGEGNETLSQTDLEIVRGSSATIDQRIVGEDMTGRAVVSISATGQVTLGEFDNELDRVQVRNFPVVSGDGTGTTSNSRSDVSVTINGLPVVVLSLSGSNGILELAQSLKVGDLVRATYFFNRTDTFQTDDVSDQVSAEAAIVRATSGIQDVNAPTPGAATLDIHADILGPNGEVIVPANNVIDLVVDGNDQTILLTPKSDYTMQQIANVITGAGAGSLTSTTFVNNFGHSALLLRADNDLVVIGGGALALLGLEAGQQSLRRRTFFVFNGPIVDGTNGGVTTTDPSHVTVKVNGLQVIPLVVDGATRAVTLDVAPAAGAKVVITYFHNTWQDTFDHLQHVGVVSVSRTGDVPGGTGFVQGADYILKDDRLVWGTSVLVSSGVTTLNFTPFDESQITPTLVDNRTFLSECAPVVQASGGLATASKTEFQLPFQPTLGNGRSTTLGQSLFQSVSNNRIGLPVNRPDVVRVYWGFSVEDALVRGEVTVLLVEGIVVTLAEEVPVGATVFATFYHNLLVDQEYTLTVALAGPSGIGTYTIQDSGGFDLFTPTFDNSTKSAGLTGVQIVFPSGSELTPDLHFEGGEGDEFAGPVDEVVTVTLASTTDTPARFTVNGSSPYSFIQGESDLVAMTLNSIAVLPTAGTDLDNISTGGGGIMAHLVGNEVAYPDGVDFDAADFTNGNEQILLSIDGVTIDATVEAGATKTVADYSVAINEAADGAIGVADANSGTAEANAGADSLTDAALLSITIPNQYVGYRIVIGDHGGTATPGQVRTVTSQTVGDFLTVDSDWAGGAMAAAVPYRIFNPDTRARYKGATRFDGPADLTTGFRELNLAVNCDNTGGPLVGIAATIASASYGTPALLASAINTALRGAAGDDQLVPPTGGSPLALAIVGDSLYEGLDVFCTADGDGRMVFQLQLPGLSSAGYLTLLVDATPADDFWVLGGFDAGISHLTDQTHLNVGAISKTYEVTIGGVKPHDRLILRNRLHPGGVSLPATDVVQQSELLVLTASGNVKAGLENQSTGEAAHGATVEAAWRTGRVGFGGGSSTTGGFEGQPLVTFFDGTGAQPKNSNFAVTIDGVPLSFDFVGSAAGTATPLGPVTGTSNGSVMDQIIDALANVALVPGEEFGSTPAAVFATGILQQVGAGLRINSQRFDVKSEVVIGSGTANSRLGFTEGDVGARVLVTSKVLASALNSHREASLATFLLDFTSTAAVTEFAAQAVAQSIIDDVGREYLHIVTTPAAAATYGTGSSISLLDAATRSWLFVGTGIDELNLSGAVGDPAMNGFFVISSNPNGSGSVDSSILNAATGQDGVIGQTYRDDVTGLTFTILPRGWHDNMVGPWVAYPNGATFRYTVSRIVTTDANLPRNGVPGVEMLVANTSGMAVGDTGIVETFDRGGNEPAIGDIYYASYLFTKQNFQTAFFTKMSSIEAAYGNADPDNPVSLASFLAIINGAVLVGIKQVQREEGSNFASLDSYVAAIEELEGVLPGHINPDIITPLRGDSNDLFLILKRSNGLQSSIRFRSERTSIIGVRAGTTISEAGDLAVLLKDDRMRLVYPDIALIDIEETDGTTKEKLIDGPMLAAMLAGSVVSPNKDVASPWTKRKLIGPNQLARQLDAVEQNQLAQKGVTVLDDRPPFIRVRHGRTTDLTSLLTSVPTVRMISDHVQQQARDTLEPFIGIKFLPSVVSQIEGRLAMMMQAQVKANIVAIYTGIRANIAPDDPTVAEVEAFYQPVFPLLYIVLTFHLRANL